MVDVAVLERCLSEIIRRHEGLRTRFTETNGMPRQVVDAPYDVRLDVLDLSGTPAAERGALSRAAVSKEIARPFDLSADRLARFSLIRLASDEHLLIAVLHHIIADGWSMSLITEELAKLYPAFAGGLTSPLAEPPLQYPDYAVWQRRWLKSGVAEAQLGYWRRRLADPPPPLALPTDRPRADVASFKGALHRFSIPKTLISGLERLAQSQGATPFMVWLAALNVVLARWTGQEDLLTGFTVAGRVRRQTEAMVGFFANTLVMRARVAGNENFEALLRRVKADAIDAYAHQDLPFEQLVAEIAPERDLASQPLLSVVLAFLNFPAPTFEFENIRLRQLEIDPQSSKFDLSLYLQPDGEGLDGRFEYASDLFDQVTIERFAGHLLRVLEQACETPDRPIGDYVLMDAAEREVALGVANPLTVPCPERLDQIFSRRALERPEAIAVVCEDDRVSYGCLEAASNRLARHLRDQGAARGAVIGVCLDRSVAMVEAVLAVLKAGCAYLPLDPRYPSERLSFMLVDSGCAAVITQEAHAETFGDWPGPRVVIDAQADLIAEQSNRPVTIAGDGADAAYVIYTSG